MCLLLMGRWGFFGESIPPYCSSPAPPAPRPDRGPPGVTPETEQPEAWESQMSPPPLAGQPQVRGVSRG